MKGAKDITSFRIRPETLEQCKRLAALHGRTLSAFVSDLLDAYVGRRVVVFPVPFGHGVNDGQDGDLPVLEEGSDADRDHQ